MSNIETIDPKQLEINSTKNKEGVQKNSEQRKREQKPQIDALLLAYMYIFQSVQVAHRTAAVQAKSLENNAVTQEWMIHEQAQVRFDSLNRWSFEKDDVVVIIKNMPWFLSIDDATQYAKLQQDLREGKGRLVGSEFIDKKSVAAKIQHVETTNQEVSAIRNVMEEKMTVLRQGAQIGETNLNSVMDEDEQAVQQGSGLLQMLGSLTNQIAKI